MNKKGFTLIELLAVIVILAIIALIAVPSVLNIIEDARKSAVEESGRSIARAAEAYYMQSVMKGDTQTSIDLAKDTLPYNGEKPEKGVVTYDGSGRAYIKMYTNGYCVVVTANNEVNADKMKKDNCSLEVIILSIDPNGGEVSEHSREYDNVGAIGELPTPTREGYTFKGWTLKDGTEVNSTTEIKENMTIYAKWEANVYEVTLNLNDGEVLDINTWDSTYKKEMTYDTAYGNLPILTKEGYTFLGWYTSADIKVLDTTLLKIANNHTLEAKFEANKYEVTFVYNNGNEDTKREVTYNNDYGILPVVEKNGYTFKGWYDENNNLIENTSLVSISKNHTLTAKFEANKFEVTFKYNDGVTSDTTKEVIYDNSYGDLPIPSRLGYTFQGWHTTGGVLIESTSKVQIIENHTLNAIWGINSYLVTFDANGGTVTPGNTEIVYGETYGSKLGDLPIPTREGYTFSGWYTDKTLGTVVTKDTIMNLGSNHYIYARWNPNTFTVTFVYNDGVTENTTKEVTYDSEYGPLPTSTRTNFTLVGWYTSEGVKINDSTIVKLGSNQTLTAQWTQSVYTFAYTGAAQTFMVPVTGKYKIELWGTSVDIYGNQNNFVGYSYGSYVSGDIHLTSSQNLYIYVGQRGNILSSAATFNGGGSSTKGTYSGGYRQYYNGGGATDIRLISGNWNNATSLNSRIMVAAGSSRATSAGGLYSDDTIPGKNFNSSWSSYYVTGATQFSGGKNTYSSSLNGNFGIGGNGENYSYGYGSRGAGGGYYGGGGSISSDWNESGSRYQPGDATSGSSFISGHTGSVAITSSSSTTPRKDSNNVACNSTSSSGYNNAGYNTDPTCSLHYSGNVFTNTIMIDGSGYDWTITNGVLNKTLKQMPNPTGGYYSSGTGHIGDGYARITYLGE